MNDGEYKAYKFVAVLLTVYDFFAFCFFAINFALCKAIGDDMGAFIFLAIFFFVAPVYFTVKAYKKTLQTAPEVEKKIQCKHFTGLPILENADCSIVFEADRLNIFSAGKNFTLSYGKISDMLIKTEEEIQKQYVSSIGGAVGGALLFGPIGAMIGGRAKVKNINQKNRYLIIAYAKDSDTQYIAFDVTSCYWEADAFVTEIKKNVKFVDTKTVEL